MDEITASTIRRAAMYMLARREQSVEELRFKLNRRFSSKAELIAAEVAKLKEEGLQSDQRLAENLVRSRVGKGQGPAKIKAEMRTKGLSDEVIKRTLVQTCVDWENLAREVAAKRFGDSPPADQKERAKRSRFLLQRGFLFEQINPVI